MSEKHVTRVVSFSPHIDPIHSFVGSLIVPLNFTPLVTNTEDVFISRTTDRDTADCQLNMVIQVLQFTTRPTSIIESEWHHLVKYALCFFIHMNNLWRKHPHGHHRIVVPPPHRLKLLSQAHDEVGHHGTYSTCTHLVEWFWWPHMDTDVKWYTDSCHVCQTRHLRQINNPPIVAMPSLLFGKVYINTFNMPRARGYAYVIHANCLLSSFPEARMLRKEMGQALTDFIFQDLLSHYGTIAEILMGNGTPYITTLDQLKTKYSIMHIRISGYNSQANGLIEQKHWDFRQVMYKAVDGDTSRWPQGFYPVLWSEHVTTTRTLDYSPYYAVHRVHPIHPFNIDKATYLVPSPESLLFEEDLLRCHAQELAKRRTDLEDLCRCVYTAHIAHSDHFSKAHAAKIHNYQFTPGSLVLVCNTHFEKSLNRKMQPRYLEPMVVIS